MNVLSWLCLFFVHFRLTRVLESNQIVLVHSVSKNKCSENVNKTTWPMVLRTVFNYRLFDERTITVTVVTKIFSIKIPLVISHWMNTYNTKRLWLASSRAESCVLRHLTIASRSLNIHLLVPTLCYYNHYLLHLLSVLPFSK